MIARWIWIWMFCWIVAVGHAVAAPIVVQPGTAAGYMYFPQQQSSGSSGTTNVNVSVSASSGPQVNPNTMKSSAAGTCASVSTIGQICEWGDGRSMRYAGVVASTGRKLFVENTSFDPQIPWGCYGITTGASGTSFGLENSNLVLTINNASPCKYAVSNQIADSPPVAFLYCAQKDMYVPAKDELQLIYNNKGSLGSFTPYYYWSASESYVSRAWLLYFSSGGWYYYYKYAAYYVRCVRSF